MRCADERATELRKSGEVVANSGRHVVGQNRSSVPDSIQSADDVGPQNVAGDLSNGITSKFETLQAPATNNFLILHDFRYEFGGRFYVWREFRQILGKEFLVQKCSEFPWSARRFLYQQQCEKLV
jgi:hypothetical protein